MLTIKNKDIHNLIGYVAMCLNNTITQHVEINCFVCSLTRDGVKAQYGNYIIELSANDTEAKVESVFNVLFTIVNDFYDIYNNPDTTVHTSDIDKCIPIVYDGESLCDGVYRYLWRGYSALYHEAAEVFVLTTNWFRLICHSHAQYVKSIIVTYTDKGYAKCNYDWIETQVRQFYKRDDHTKELRQLIHEELDKRCLHSNYTATDFLLDIVLLREPMAAEHLLAAIKESLP